VTVRVPKFAPESDMSQAAVLVIDDEQPALDELGSCSSRTPGRRRAHRDSATEALRLLQERRSTRSSPTSQMPGLTGLELARCCPRFRSRRRWCS
jgi:hypothetical protein